MMKPEVRKRRQDLAATAFVIVFGAALAWTIAGVDERRVPEPSITALRTTDLIVDHNITLGSGVAVMTTYPGDPNTHVGATKGSFILDTSTPGVWQNTTGSNVWIAAGGSGGGGGSGVTSIACSTGLSCSPSPIISTGTITMANTAVTPGSYTNTNLTVDAQGRITAAANGSAGSGGGGGGIGSGSLAVTVAAFPGSTTNISTVGTFDWFWWGASGAPATIPNYANATATSYHWKKGGLLFKSVEWLGGGNSSGPGIFPGTTTFTSGSADDSYNLAMSVTDGTYFQVSAIGPGYQINIPASITSRTLRLYIGAKGVDTTITASLDDASATGSAATYSAASGVNVQKAVDIVFQAGSTSRLRVTVIATVLNGGIQAEELWGMAEF